jgi:hypothetical protein
MHVWHMRTFSFLARTAAYGVVTVIQLMCTHVLTLPQYVPARIYTKSRHAANMKAGSDIWWIHRFAPAAVVVMAIMARSGKRESMS